MRVSNSSIQTFKQCPRMYQLRYIYGFKPITKSEAIETGLSYHDALESLIRGNEQPITLNDDKTSAMVNAFESLIFPTVMAYDKFEPEKWFEYRTKKGNLVVGRYDGIGKHSLLEHKSTSQAICGSYWESVQDDEQLLTYMMASGKRKALYTVCRRPSIRRSQNESDKEFADRLKKWYETDTEQKISCNEVFHTGEEVRRHEHEIDLMCDTIQGCKNFYRNRSFCKHWGRMCEYAPICNNCDPYGDYIGFVKEGV